MAHKILIVDDDQEFRQELREFLEGYEIIEASDGVQALTLLRRANEIGLVLLDVNMPGVSGTDVLREMKRIDPDLGIVILTGYSSKDVAIEALKGRADDYIEKPLDIGKIKNIIDKVLESKQGSAEIDASDIEGKVRKVKNFAELNCFKKISLKDAAQAVCLSPKYLSRIFKQYSGMGFSEYRLKIKIRKAKELLHKGGLNINQLADKLGYENAESFIRQFKKLTRQTPTEYRRKSRAPRHPRRNK